MADQKPAEKKPRQTRKGRARTLTEQMTGELAALLARELVPDLTRRARQPAVEQALRRRHAAERAARRTAATFEAWAAHTVEQVGAAWILSCLFVRVLEDRGLMDRRRIAGPGALDAQQLFFDIAPSLTERDYLLTVFRELADFPGMADVLGPRHNPAWRLSPSNDAVRALLGLLRQTGPDGALRFGFAGTDTRFLGDLYQDLSESVRQRYALLQTPGFVERFILDQTLEPAIAGFGLDAVRVLDPTCGSGHFLLGAFERLVEHRMRTRPGLDRREHARDALAQVFGVDVNPYAVAIARFRLTLAYLAAAGIDTLARAPRIETNLVVADSLLHETAHQQGRLSDLSDRSEDKAAWGDEMFALDDPETARRILRQRYHAVVGNPPYITCKDEELRKQYRDQYVSCHKQFSLGAPFTERFFQIAEERGFVGMITANSFMKREFGKPLIEKVLPRYDLTHVVDTSGAFIPGHGTPTVLLFGRNQRPVLATVRAVLGKRGEPGTPDDAEKGHVWSSIAGHFDEPRFENEYISVADVPRETFAKHPWSLGGGGAGELKELLESRANVTLVSLIRAMGRVCHTGNDEAFVAPLASLKRQGLIDGYTAAFIEGGIIRDWALGEPTAVVFPYDRERDLARCSEDPNDRRLRFLWPYRTMLWERREPNGTHREIGLTWYEFSRFHPERFIGPGIAFAFVATHNHFVLDRGGKVFNRSAPIIKLPASATEDDHLALLAYLNSSTAAFYFRQAGHSKGAQGVNEGHKSEIWEQFLEYSGTLAGSLPVPTTDALTPTSRAMLVLADARTAVMPAACMERYQPGGTLDLAQDLAACRQEAERLMARMVAVQEEIDWMVYEAFGLLTDDDRALLRCARGEALAGFPQQIDTTATRVERLGLHPGHRPFEILLARRCQETDATTVWFARNRYRDPTEVPAKYAPAYQRLIDARITIIQRNKRIQLVEQPEHKHRWIVPDYDAELRDAGARFLLDAAERALTGASDARRARLVADEVLAGAKAREVASLVFADRDDLNAAVVDLLLGDAVPFLTAQRFTESGLAKHAAWQETWALQRAEDAGEKPGDVPVPPRYKSTDYAAAGFWRLRGKLDVPKERFISYPGAEGDDDRSPLIGWAGWDHLQRAQALAALLQQRNDNDGWEAARLTPLLAGLDELLPWLKQWHNQPDPAFDNQRMGDLFEDFTRAQARALGLDLEQVRAWMPARKQGRKSAVKDRVSAAKKKPTTRKRATKPAEEA